LLLKLLGAHPKSLWHAGIRIVPIAFELLTEYPARQQVGNLQRHPCTAPKLVAWFLTWVSSLRLHGLIVLADHAAEYLPPPDWEVQQIGGLGFLVGRALLAGLVGPVAAVMAGVFAENRSQTALVAGEHPVGALGDGSCACGEMRSLPAGVTLTAPLRRHAALYEIHRRWSTASGGLGGCSA
jgi:hypothetical protein